MRLDSERQWVMQQTGQLKWFSMTTIYMERVKYLIAQIDNQKITAWLQINRVFIQDRSLKELKK